MRTLVLAAALAVLASPVLSAQPGYIGTWAIVDVPCPKSRFEGDSYYQITSKKVIEHEGQCAVSKLVSAPTGWTAQLSCTSEGESMKRKVHWSIDENDRLIQFESGVKSVYKRCPAVPQR